MHHGWDLQKFIEVALCFIFSNFVYTFVKMKEELNFVFISLCTRDFYVQALGSSLNNYKKTLEKVEERFIVLFSLIGHEIISGG